VEPTARHSRYLLTERDPRLWDITSNGRICTRHLAGSAWVSSSTYPALCTASAAVHTAPIQLNLAQAAGARTRTSHTRHIHVRTHQVHALIRRMLAAGCWLQGLHMSHTLSLPVHTTGNACHTHTRTTQTRRSTQLRAVLYRITALHNSPSDTWPFSEQIRRGCRRCATRWGRQAKDSLAGTPPIRKVVDSKSERHLCLRVGGCEKSGESLGSRTRCVVAAHAAVHSWIAASMPVRESGLSRRSVCKSSTLPHHSFSPDILLLSSRSSSTR
jgi:hypothetical protein